jgi:hypothetical protein
VLFMTYEGKSFSLDEKDSCSFPLKETEERKRKGFVLNANSRDSGTVSKNKSL